MAVLASRTNRSAPTEPSCSKDEASSSSLNSDATTTRHAEPARGSLQLDLNDAAPDTIYATASQSCDALTNNTASTIRSSLLRGLVRSRRLSQLQLTSNVDFDSRMPPSAGFETFMLPKLLPLEQDASSISHGGVIPERGVRMCDNLPVCP